MGIPEEEREKGVESLFKEIIAKKFPNLRKELDIQVHEAKRTLLLSYGCFIGCSLCVD